MKPTLKYLKQLGHAGGADATRAMRLNLHGTRYGTPRSASHAPDQTAALGIGLRSVWDGPKKRPNGAPALKRSQQA